jgi:hypothetical protein
MEQGTIIFLVILALLVAIPIVIYNRNKKLKERKFLNALFQYAGKTLSEYQIWNQIIIAIDRSEGKMFFFRRSGTVDITKEVDLSGVSKCHVINSGNNINSGKGSYVVTNRIDLGFRGNNNQPDTVFEIYNSNLDSPTLQGELQLAEKWAITANSYIAEKH